MIPGGTRVVGRLEVACDQCDLAVGAVPVEEIALDHAGIPGDRPAEHAELLAQELLRRDEVVVIRRHGHVVDAEEASRVAPVGLVLDLTALDDRPPFVILVEVREDLGLCHRAGGDARHQRHRNPCLHAHQYGLPWPAGHAAS